jgi:hypothetical protein
MQLGYTMYESETRKSAYRFVCLVLGAYTLPLEIHFSINILHSSFSAERGTLFGRARDTEHRPWAVGAVPGSHKLTTIQFGQQSQSLYTQRCLTGSVQCHIYPLTFED